MEHKQKNAQSEAHKTTQYSSRGSKEALFYNEYLKPRWSEWSFGEIIWLAEVESDGVWEIFFLSWMWESTTGIPRVPT